MKVHHTPFLIDRCKKKKKTIHFVVVLIFNAVLLRLIQIKIPDGYDNEKNEEETTMEQSIKQSMAMCPCLL